MPGRNCAPWGHGVKLWSVRRLSAHVCFAAFEADDGRAAAAVHHFQVCDGFTPLPSNLQVQTGKTGGVPHAYPAASRSSRAPGDLGHIAPWLGAQ